jgi:hypothetical protein
VRGRGTLGVARRPAALLGRRRRGVAVAYWGEEREPVRGIGEET